VCLCVDSLNPIYMICGRTTQFLYIFCNYMSEWISQFIRPLCLDNCNMYVVNTINCAVFLDVVQYSQSLGGSKYSEASKTLTESWGQIFKIGHVLDTIQCSPSESLDGIVCQQARKTESYGPSVRLLKVRCYLPCNFQVPLGPSRCLLVYSSGWRG